MDNKLWDLCRMCAKKHKFSKDLLDDNNKNLLDLIRQFTQISITECDNMPTRLCLDCEEKMVAFQLFILESYKTQDYLRKLCLENPEIFSIKTESVDFGVTVIKSEVKDELSAEFLLADAIPDNGDGDYDGSDFRNITSEEDDLDNITIASLKQLKTKTVQKKESNLDQPHTKTTHKPNKKLKSLLKELIKLECNLCQIKFQSWTLLQVHFSSKHKSKPVIYCNCGYPIKSKSVLYKHLTEHKAENKKREKSGDSGDGDSQKIKINNYVVFKCPSCNKVCSSWYTLKSHCERYHKLAPVVNCKCGVLLKSKSSLYKHVQDHKISSNLSCDLCSKVMKSTAALAKHQLRHVPKAERQYVCETCNKVFKIKDLLRSHQRSHIPIEERKVFSCDICNLKFTTRSAAMSHRRVVHDKVKAYVCDLCGYACGTNGELRQHRAIHSDDKPYVCGTCAKSFKTYSNLKTHMDIHGDTSYVCYVCSRVLNSRRTLRKHLLVHEEKCRHVCSYCNKAFKRRQTLKVHMHTHTGDKPLSCKWCEERFSYASTLRSHRLRAHPDKMAARPHDAYSPALYAQHAPHQDYIKSDLVTIEITKNNVTEAIIH